MGRAAFAVAWPLQTLGGSKRSRCGAGLIFLRALGGSNCSRCGAAHILRLQSEPSAHFERVGSLSPWLGALFEIAKCTLCALWVG